MIVLEIWGDAGDLAWWQVQRVGAPTRRAGGWAQDGDSVSPPFPWASSAVAGAGGAAGHCEGWTCPARQPSVAVTLQRGPRLPPARRLQSWVGDAAHAAAVQPGLRGSGR